MTGEALLCPRCQCQIIEGQIFCSRCGSRIESPVVAIPVCANCGATVDRGGAFCWKCGVPLSTGVQPHIPAPAESLVPPGAAADSSLPVYGASSGRVAAVAARSDRNIGGESFLPIGRRRAPLWSIVAIAALAISFGAFAGLVLTGEWDRLIGRSIVYIDGVNETGTFTGGGYQIPLELKLGCDGCPITITPGSHFVLSWVLQDTLSLNTSITYTTLALTPGSGWSGTIVPATPFTLTFAQTQIVTLTATAPNTPGSYFVPITINLGLS